ncbi:uncharacterized protein B0I36DRAFT_344050 [Microdochium trichocladiopsis]|uniref:Phosphotransferase n=1 Tax=Microdochium trichocladiopsis TaxID=1682393 RepID=A0A9P8YGV4_9PEZI|nr:uncharacterized protein B0I36DRAFT_344050 [Microdochium trichocladiopsis]KAH7040281.1 hypothetical protein B0I36DRAFT_344050 [Microdochium trichocladiopsis]
MALNTTMATFRKAILTALQQLLRGKSFIQAVLSLWVSPRQKDRPSSPDNLSPNFVPKSADQFLQELEEAFLGRVQHDGLKALSNGLKSQYRERLHIVGENMLPSFNHLLPTGGEVGEFLALDVGGSTLRVAVVQLRGRSMAGREAEIARLSSFKITPEIKQLEGLAFFDWMADRIHEVLGEDRSNAKEEIRLGLAWSFAIDQVSPGGALLMGMGKGFLATRGLMGQDLGELIRFACKRRGLNVRLGAIVNDGSATLLSQAYVHDSTHFGLILGTGSNMSVHLPVSALGRAKYGNRPDSWFAAATHVIVNTEMSMFGKGFLPMTRWDHLLNEEHPRPDFQPLEHLVSGYYLGEICRLVLVEAIQSVGIFGGEIPTSLEKPYSLDTATVSTLESDTTPTLETGLPYFLSHHAFPAEPTLEDVQFLRTIATMVSRRAAAVIATCVFSLWELRHETEAEDRLKQESKSKTIARGIRSISSSTIPKSMTPSTDEQRAAIETPPTPPEDKDMFPLPTTQADGISPGTNPISPSSATQSSPYHATVAYNGSVIEHYPGLRANCQAVLDDLVRSSSIYNGKGSVELVPTKESSLLGAAVALACVTEEEIKLAASAGAADVTGIIAA